MATANGQRGQLSASCRVTLVWSCINPGPPPHSWGFGGIHSKYKMQQTNRIAWHKNLTLPLQEPLPVLHITIGRPVPIMGHLSEMHVPEGDRGAAGRHRRPYRGPRGQLACGRKSGEWRLRIFGFLVRLLFVAKL